MRSKIFTFICYRLGIRPLARAFERGKARALARRWQDIRPDLFWAMPPKPRRERR